MELTGLQIGLDVVISLLFGAAGALGVWFKLKNVVNIQRVQIESLQDDVKQIRAGKKELAAGIHKRVDSLKTTVEKNREKQDGNHTELKSDMQKMELRIIQAIHEIKR